ncbi:MAG TPA: enoyl-CoA hydratase-related protein, partial [Magnetospirillum sp.]|nr:enoyl-CoA hydratase-related protein [Magnetospirillum sp.]
MTQRLHVELRQLGHEVSVEFDIKDSVTVEAVGLFQPDLVVAPFLKRAIPEAVWSKHVCLVVHPGPEGDRGPSALDWAILEGKAEWGVTVLQANAEMDGGPVWESRTFPMRPASKGSIYRNEVTEAAVEAVLACVARFPEAKSHPASAGAWKPAMKQADRAVDWQADDVATVLRKVRSADGVPGVLAILSGREVFLHDAHPATGLSGEPGALLAKSRDAVAVACKEGAVWIGHVRQRGGVKLPAARLLGQGLPEAQGPQDIVYEECGDVGILHFPFLNGAMGTDQCRRLLAAYEDACRRPTRVIVLAGGPDFWSNGVHLNRIEDAASPSDESWANINAMDDLCRAIITTVSHVTVAALRGNAGAGGVFLALAADHVWARTGVVLNPHYKGMGNLYGSEYWTYLLPRRAGAAAARRVT